MAEDFDRDRANGRAQLVLTADTAGLLAESANNALRGVRVPDFESSGGDREAALELHQELNAIYYEPAGTGPRRRGGRRRRR